MTATPLLATLQVALSEPSTVQRWRAQFPPAPRPAPPLPAVDEPAPVDDDGSITAWLPDDLTPRFAPGGHALCESCGKQIAVLVVDLAGHEECGPTMACASCMPGKGMPMTCSATKSRDPHTRCRQPDPTGLVAGAPERGSLSGSGDVPDNPARVEAIKRMPKPRMRWWQVWRLPADQLYPARPSAVPAGDR